MPARFALRVFSFEVPMPVPSTINDLSTTAASNYPAGTENPFPDSAKYMRAHAAFIAQLRDGKLNASAVSAFILTLLDDADAATARATLGAVGLTGNQTVAGVKTFSSAPVSSAAAAAANELVRKAELDSAVASSVPAGAVQAFAMSSAPAGWIKANGDAVSRTTYAALFAAIGTTYGAGDGSTTFNLPELRGEFIRGWDDGRGVDSGRTFGSSQIDAFQGHWHSTYATGNITAVGDQAVEDGPRTFTTNSSNTAVLGAVSDNVNGTPRTASETRPRNVALLYCIKT